jgi:hypothetical protein
MTVLGLNRLQGQHPIPVQLPSAFPDRADVYLCDNCGRNITKHLHPGRAHCWQAMGPQRYVCRCSARYLSGCVEWDHLGDWERRRRVRDTFGLSMLFSVGSLILSTPVYFAMRYVGFGKAALITAAAITALPAALMVVPFSVEVWTSIWRTRVRRTG